MQIIGKAIPSFDAWEKVKGNVLYADDFFMQGMLFGKILRSKYPAALIRKIDTLKARQLEGVAAVLTFRDVPNNEMKAKFGQNREIGEQFEGLYRVLARDKIRFLGEPIALIAAKTEKIAEQAMELIEVDYEIQQGVFDPEEALKPGAYLVGEDPTNMLAHFEIERGDVEKGFAEADITVENTYHVPFVDHAYLEPECGIAWVDMDGVVNIRVATQVIEHYRTVADVLGVPHSKVRVIGTYVGGGFGGKEDITVESFLALLTVKTGKPVKITYTREESILAHSKRHALVMRYRHGAKKDGTLVALAADLVSNAGAYPYLTSWVLLYNALYATGPYRIPDLKINAIAALTNNPFGSANRGFGSPQVNFAYESQMDELAVRLGLDPLEIRKKNYLEQGDAISTGWVYDKPVLLSELTDKAWTALGPSTLPKAPYIKIGRGLGAGMLSYGRLLFMQDTSRSSVRLEMDGSVVIRCGVPDIGGGQAASLCQIASEELSVPLSKINIYISDTAMTPLAGTTTATRQLYMSGNATLMAAREIKKRLLKRAAEILGDKEDEIELKDEEAVSTVDPTRKLSLKELISAANTAGVELFYEAQFNAPVIELPGGKLKGRLTPDFTFGVQAVEVAVDIETGQVEVLKAVTCYDVGQALNSLSCSGQLEGGSVYGLSYGLWEDLVVEQGYLKTPSLSEYLIPTALDVPEVQSIMLESGSGLGPYGAKGVGEPAVNGAAPAALNAIRDAIGVRITSLPATPEKVFTALINSVKSK